MRIKRQHAAIAAGLLLWTAFFFTQHAHKQLNFAYIGPGAGFVFIGSFLTAVLSLLATLVSLVTWPIRALWLMMRSQRRFRGSRVKKLVLVGLDGLDPRLTEQFMAEGKMPTFAKLRDDGSYSRLRTTFPAISPVAWSTFATGVNPAKHNIFDFLNRDLRTYLPELSSARVRPPRRILRIGKLAIPLSRPDVEFRRRSEAFWRILGRHAVPSTILRVPVSFPPQDFYGQQLSAMATPDLRGTQGEFSWFSSEPEHATAAEGGNRYLLARDGRNWQGELLGPDTGDGNTPLRVAFQVRPTQPGEAMLFIMGEEHKLKAGQYTPWIRLRFRAGWGRSVNGIARFLLTASEPLSLYVTPVQLDPERPALPISQPRYYASYLAKLLGPFSTLGMAEDTWALNEGVIGEDAFLEQTRLIQNEREAMFFSALEHTRRGVVACVFDHTDRIQHMFFRYLSSNGGETSQNQTIEYLYRDCDRLLAKTLKQIDEKTALFVLSDHGFCAFRWGVNLNSWLLQEGYLALKPGSAASGAYFENVDWSRTRAYTFGLGGLYLNLLGREKYGIVSPENAPGLESELIEKLSGLHNDVGELAIREVYAAREIYRGPYRDMAPDLVIGYAEGHRASWDAAVGRVTAHIFEENRKAWSGDHCVDPILVPGVLFSNLKMNAQNPGIEDLAPTVLSLFGISPPDWMEGEPLLASH